MKKTRFLVLALAVAVMMMGAGYAWWSETLSVTGSVTTGNLDVDLTEASVVTASTSPYISVTPRVVNDGSVTIAYDDLYPGATGTAQFTVTNNGTMAVRLGQNSVFSVDNDANLLNIPLFTDNVDIDYSSTAGSRQLSVNSNGTCTYTGANIVIEPGQSAVFKLSATLDTAVTDSDENEGEVGPIKTLTFNFRPEFYQFNDNVNN